MLLKAAKRSAEHSANLEARAQLLTALEEIKKLPTGLERDNLELNAHIALIGPTIALEGFAAAAVAGVSCRAIELCHALDDDPRIFPALYAQWSYLRVAGNMREASALAKDFLTIAELKGTRTDRMVGHRLLGTSMIDGDAAKARHHLEGATKLYDKAADHATAVIYGTDVQVTSLSNLTCASSIGCWAGSAKRSCMGEPRWNWRGNYDDTHTPSVMPLPTSVCCTPWSATFRWSKPWGNGPLSAR